MGRKRPRESMRSRPLHPPTESGSTQSSFGRGRDEHPVDKYAASWDIGVVNMQGPKCVAILSQTDFRSRAYQLVSSRLIRDANSAPELVEADPTGKADVGKVKHGLDSSNISFERAGFRTFDSKKAQERFRPLV